MLFGEPTKRRAERSRVIAACECVSKDHDSGSTLSFTASASCVADDQNDWADNDKDDHTDARDSVGTQTLGDTRCTEKEE
jgi:hypothetical protein